MYDNSILAGMQEQFERAAEYEFYNDTFERADVDPSLIDSWEDFQSLPFTEPSDLKTVFNDAIHGGMPYAGGSMVSFSPIGEDLTPVYDTTADLEYQASVNAGVYERMGISKGDRVVNTFGYQLFGTGIIIHRGLEELGAEVYPLGPGDSEQVADLLEEFDIDVLVGNPSFGLKIADAGGVVDTFVGCGEPFTSIPGYREEVKDALGCSTAVDYFGIRHAFPIGAETAAEKGLKVTTDNVLIEIVDPDTGEPLSPGNRGEVVVTHRRKEGFPLVRYLTGDLAELESRNGEYVLPDGIIGRTDDRLKVKGVKIYPEAIPAVLAAFGTLTGEYRIEVTRPESTDHLKIVCEGEADEEALTDALADRLLCSPDVVSTVENLDATGNIDNRY